MPNRKVDNPMGNFVIKVGNNRAVQRTVLASFGMCNLGMQSKDCSLAIQIDKKNFPVRGTGIDDHGDSHDENGLCNTIRVADVNGTVKDGVFVVRNLKINETK